MGFLPPLDVLARLPLAPLAAISRPAYQTQSIDPARGCRPARGMQRQRVRFARFDRWRFLRRGCRCCGSKGCAERSVSGSLGKDASCRLEARCEDRCDNQTYHRAARLWSLDTAYDVAVLALGANDVARLLSVSRWRARQSQLRNQLRARFKVRKIFVTAVHPSCNISQCFRRCCSGF